MAFEESTPDPLSTDREVTYRCGSCGYALNLRSSNRNTTNIGSKYGKAIKKGIVSFFSIDDSRFSQIDELSCVPYFRSDHSWGIFRRRTKLMCRECGNFIGSAYDEGSDPNRKKYDIKISALQPSGTPLFT